MGFFISFWKKLDLWILAARGSDSYDSWEGRSVDTVCRVGNQPGSVVSVFWVPQQPLAQPQAAVCEQPVGLCQECQDSSEH